MMKMASEPPEMAMMSAAPKMEMMSAAPKMEMMSAALSPLEEAFGDLSGAAPMEDSATSTPESSFVGEKPPPPGEAGAEPADGGG